MKKVFTNKELEIMSYESQVGMFLSNIEKLANGWIVYSQVVDSEYWNFLTCFSAQTIQEFEQVVSDAKKFFKKIHREFVISINPTVEISEEVELYLKENYNYCGTSVCMMTDNIICRPRILEGYSFRQINNKNESLLFVNTFKTSKTQTLSTDVYPALKDCYFDALLLSFKNEHKWDYRHYISEYQKSPVGMVSAVISKDLQMCGLYGGGTYVAHRGKGVFSNLLKYVQNELKKENIKHFCLFTAKNSNNEKLYKELNFKTMYDIDVYKQNKFNL